MICGKTLKKIRISGNMSLIQISRKIDTDKSYLSRCENDKAHAGKDLIVKYCIATGQEIDNYFFEANLLPSSVMMLILSNKSLFDFLCLASTIQANIPAFYWEKLTQDLKEIQKEPIKK